MITDWTNMFEDKDFDGDSCIPVQHAVPDSGNLVSVRSEDIESTSKTAKSTTTNPVTCKDCEQQTTFTKNAEVQVEPPNMAGTPDYDEQALASFLKKICPKVLKELDKANKSKAFTLYRPPNNESSQELKQVLSFQKPKLQMQHDKKVCSLAWSCAGGSVILGLGSATHESWCSHAGYICVYNVIRNTGQVSVTPSKLLEANSCVTHLDTHLTVPSILVSGHYRGTIIIWDLQQDGAECVATVTGHNDPVTQVTWVDSSGARPYIVSAGQDGRMHVWNHSKIEESCTLKESYVLTSADPGGLEPGISCFSFSPLRKDVFVAALEGGKIVHCCRDYASPASRVGSDVPLKTPVLGEVEGHKGFVTCVEFSSQKEDIFLTVGTDQEIHVYSVLEHFRTYILPKMERSFDGDVHHLRSLRILRVLDVSIERSLHFWKNVVPLKVIQCGVDIFGASWCLAETNAFFTWGHMSEMTVYDSKSGRKLLSLNMGNESVICAAKYNKKSPDLIAVSDTEGSASVWKMPLHFDVTS